MKRIYIASAIFLIGCHGPSRQYMPNAARPLTSAESTNVKAINDALNNTDEAVQKAFPAAKPADAAPIESKLQKMTDMISQGHCAESGQAAVEDFSADFEGKWQVGSDQCPITYVQSSQFSRAQRTWTAGKSWNLKTTDLQNLSGMGNLTMAGSVAATGAGANHNVQGHLAYDTFQVNGVGAVSADVIVKIVTSNAFGSGSVILTIFTNARDQVQATVKWSSRAKDYQYFVNEVQMDSKGFAELFSSFALTEIMDRSLKIR